MAMLAILAACHKYFACGNKVLFCSVLSLCLNGHFPCGPGLAGTRVSILDFIGAKDDGGDGDNWGHKTYKTVFLALSSISSFLLFQFIESFSHSTNSLLLLLVLPVLITVCISF